MKTDWRDTVLWIAFLPTVNRKVFLIRYSSMHTIWICLTGTRLRKAQEPFSGHDLGPKLVTLTQKEKRWLEKRDHDLGKIFDWRKENFHELFEYVFHELQSALLMPKWLFILSIQFDSHFGSQVAKSKNNRSRHTSCEPAVILCRASRIRARTIEQYH